MRVNPQDFDYPAFLKMKMIELHATEWLVITGRGNVAVIDTPWEDFSLLKNQDVLIDGKRYSVRGIESFYPRKASDPFGLLVREVDGE